MTTSEDGALVLAEVDEPDSVSEEEPLLVGAVDSVDDSEAEVDDVVAGVLEVVLERAAQTLFTAFRVWASAEESQLYLP